MIQTVAECGKAQDSQVDQHFDPEEELEFAAGRFLLVGVPRQQPPLARPVPRGRLRDPPGLAGDRGRSTRSPPGHPQEEPLARLDLSPFDEKGRSSLFPPVVHRQVSKFIVY